MKHRLIASGFMLLQSSLLLMTQGSLSIVVLVLIAVAIALLAPEKLRVGRRGYLILLAVSFAWMIVSRAIAYWQQQDPYGFFQFFAQYLLIVQALELYRREHPGLSDYFSGLGIMQIACTLAQTETGMRREFVEIVSAITIVFALFLLRPSSPIGQASSSELQQRKRKITITLGAIVLFFGWITAEILNDTVPLATRLLLNVSETQRVRFSTTQQYVQAGGLNSVRESQQANPNAVALKIYSDTEPGYLRGSVCETFAGNRWRPANTMFARPTLYPTKPAAQRMTIETGHSLFRLKPQPQMPFQTMKVVGDQRRGSSMFAPLATAFVAGNGSKLVLEPSGVFRGLTNSSPYTLYVVSNSIEPLLPAYRKATVEPVADDHDESLRQMSDQLLGKFDSTREKLRMLELFFKQNFQYSLESNPAENRGDMSPLAAFLLLRRPAHCEFFATGALAMLRYQGIPCRYVVGYRVYDRDDSDDYFIARNRNAHAWVEAYDEENQRWRIVEATPGIPSPYERRSLLQQEAESQRSEEDDLLLADSRGWYSKLFIAGPLFDAMQFLSRQVHWILLTAVIVGVAIYIRSRKRSLVSGNNYLPLSTCVHQANRTAKRLGFVRGPSETWLRFSQRLRLAAQESKEQSDRLNALSQWYQDYAAARYQADPIAAIGKLAPPPKI